jgi:hypothetical protein
LEGTHPLKLILEDSKGKTREYTLDLKITMKEPFFAQDMVAGNVTRQNEAEIKKVKENNVFKPKEYVLSAKIESVS